MVGGRFDMRFWGDVGGTCWRRRGSFTGFVSVDANGRFAVEILPLAWILCWMTAFFGFHFGS